LTAACLLAGCGGSDETTSTAATSTRSETTTPGERDPATGDGAGGVQLEELGEFEGPVFVTQPDSGDDEHLYVVEQGGVIQRVPIDGGEPQPFLDLTSLLVCCGEQGLLSMTFAPNYERSGLLYVNYTEAEGSSVTAEYRRSADDPAVADPDSARELLRIEDFAANHNGGLLQFGPDGKLYLGMGDGGGGGDPERTAQDLASPLGKLLRIDVDEPGEYEVAALGLRNPWRYSFDPEAGEVWIGDVGQESLEEIDAVAADELGGSDPPNFGWSAFEGTRVYNEDQSAPGAIAPVLEYGRDNGECSVTGGYVVRDPSLPSLFGRYLYGDYCAGELRSFPAKPERGGAGDRALGLHVDQLSSFGVDASGHYYAISLDGPVYRLVSRPG
jgi:glucose/arabinose dehydrogenase